MHIEFATYNLHFKQPGGTSRGILTDKETFFVKIKDTADSAIEGIGECALFRGLSADDVPEYETRLSDIRKNGISSLEELKHFPSILFGIETALLDLKNGGNRIIYNSDFSAGKDFIPINGLIWMGTKESMRSQIIDKIEKGFSCIKLKIGAIDFETELALIKSIRNEFNANTITIRTDANGAFSPKEAMDKLNRLSAFDIHSIEQPIRAGQWEAMADLCRHTPIPIALDEELIGIYKTEEKIRLLQTIQPHFIILKPSLHGSFSGCEAWIQLAEKHKAGWWVTSALESNIGLNAIAQWCYTLNHASHQGLGTGQLFTNNIQSPLLLQGEKLYYNPDITWNTSQIQALF